MDLKKLLEGEGMNYNGQMLVFESQLVKIITLKMLIVYGLENFDLI